MAAATVAPVGMYVNPLIVSAERWIGSRQRLVEAWLAEPAAPVADRRLEARVRLVDVLWDGLPLGQESAQKAWSPCAS